MTRFRWVIVLVSPVAAASSGTPPGSWFALHNPELDAGLHACALKDSVPGVTDANVTFYSRTDMPWWTSSTRGDDVCARLKRGKCQHMVQLDGGCHRSRCEHAASSGQMVFCGLDTTPAEPTLAPRIVHRTQAFTQLHGGYHTYRIPSLVAAADRMTLIAVVEGRAPQHRGPPVGNVSLCWGQLASLFDWQCYSKDIVLRRSMDGGETFGGIDVIAKSNRSVLYTNPLLLLDEITTKLWLAYVRCPIPPGAPPGRSVFQNCTQLVRMSTNHGGSWSAEREIEGSYPQRDGGVGSGLQLSANTGSSNGRLLFPRNGKGTLISDNHGENWRLGQPLPHSGESQAVQLSNGSVAMQMRDGDHRYDYVWCISDDGGESFRSSCTQQNTPLVPDVPTSILRLEKALLFSHPNSDVVPCPLGRKNMTVSMSADGNGEEWRDVLQVFEGPAAYSSLAVLAGGRVGLLYEKSSDGKEPIDFESIELAIIEGLV